MGKVRLELIADFGPRRGQTFSGIVVDPSYDDILRAALNKLKVKKKNGLLLVLRDRFQGAKLLSPDADLKMLLRDGAAVVLTTQRPALRLPRPPRWPWPSCLVGAGSVSSTLPSVPQTVLSLGDQPKVVEHTATLVDKDESSEQSPSSLDFDAALLAAVPKESASASSAELLVDATWCGAWPVLQGDVRSLVRRSVAGCNSFLEKDMGGYIAFDYKTSSASELPDMFPDPHQLPRKGDARLLAAVRRECRGLLLCCETGQVLARRLPKFFNVDEVQETQISNLPLSGGTATHKVDGSLVSPFLLAGAVRWAGKAALCPDVEAFASSQIWLAGLVDRLLRQGYTPLFEWCTAGPPVGVMTHAQNRLVLLAVRHTISGEFWPDENVRMLGIEVTEKVSFQELPTLLSQCRALKNSEGVVVTWQELGLMVKFKSTWWVSLAAAQKRGHGNPALSLLSMLKSMHLSSIPSGNIWQAVLNGDDDQMALVYGHLAPTTQASLRAFASVVDQGFQDLNQELLEWGESVSEAGEADMSGIAGGWPISLLAAYQRRSPSAGKELRKFLSAMAAAGDLLALETLTAATWNCDRQAMEACSHLGTFDSAPHGLIEHVLAAYLPRKLEEYLGQPLTDKSLVLVARLYEASEGKIKGLWEQFSDDGIIDLRVDLQPRAKSFDFHNGDPDFAHWQVQFGPNDQCPRSTRAQDGDRRGAFAGVLMRTGVEVAFGQLREAMELSFKTHSVVKLDPSPSRISHIFLDLDGVICDFDAGFEKHFGGVPDAKDSWQHIARTKDFYGNLPWTAQGKRLWEWVQQTGLPITILTGIPEGSLGERSAAEKRAWVSRELGEGVDIITCLTREKPAHSGPGRLLIDDRPQKGWEANRGRQILHRSVPETLSALVGLGLGKEFVVPREKILFVQYLTDELKAARAQAELVALDVKWVTDWTGALPDATALLQLAFSRQGARADEVFVVDGLGWDEELNEFIQRLLSDEQLTKLHFGCGDAELLQKCVSSAIDLQQGGQSLATQARSAGILLRKRKQLQAPDWSVRPLEDEQLIHAATDVLVLLELFDGKALESSAQVQSSSSRLQSSGCGRRAAVEYIGIFLSTDSRTKLLRRFPPKFAKIAANQMILSWQPELVKGLAVGATVKLRVRGTGHDDRIQAVSVETAESQPRIGQIIISHLADLDSAEPSSLTFDGFDEPMTLEGVLGVGVVMAGMDRNQLSAQILSKLDALVEDGQPGATKRFDGLTDGERFPLHLAADELGLEHRSEGKKGSQHRKLILTIPKRWQRPSGNPCEVGARAIVRDARKFSALFGDMPGQHLHGCVSRSGGISWEPGLEVHPALLRLLEGEPAQGDRLVIILRGFPGSGKSSLAARLQRAGHVEIASADNYFTDVASLQDAHEQCRQRFMKALESNQTVLVDNTNVRRSDYAFYQGKAKSHGYEAVVLEFVCETTAELERMRKRSRHAVPGGAVGAMWSRWESDPASIRFQPYLPQELLPWLRAQSMLGGRPATHLFMPDGPFLSVPASSRDFFFTRFEAEWGCHPISEQARPQAFKLFFDIDGLSLDRLISALSALQTICCGPLFITGTEEPPAPGYHIFVPSKVVNSAEAAALRLQWIDAEPDIKQYVDDQLYQAPQLRLLGSRKVSKEGIDVGRVHRFVGRFDGSWEGDSCPYRWSDVSILI